jgi:flagellar motility protein MotE (MotC chaperone)
MRELKASPILAAMDPAKAKEVTLALTDKADAKSASAAQPPAPAPAPQKAVQ